VWPILRSSHDCCSARLVTKETLIDPKVKDYYLAGREMDLSPDVMDPQYLELFVHCHPDHGIGEDATLPRTTARNLMLYSCLLASDALRVR
jgi:hypothetical protein